MRAIESFTNHPLFLTILLVLVLLTPSVAAESVERVVNGEFNSAGQWNTPTDWTMHFVDWGMYEAESSVSFYPYEGRINFFQTLIMSGKGELGHYQYVDLTDVNELTYIYATTWVSSANNCGYLTLNDVVVRQYTSETNAWVSETIDVSGYTGSTKVHFYVYDSVDAGACLMVDDVSAMTVEAVNYNSTSTGSIDLNIDSSLFTGEPISFDVDVTHEENTEYLYHNYYIDNGVDSWTIADDESIYDYMFSVLPSVSGEVHVELYETYAYYLPAEGYSVVENNLLDEIYVNVVDRPSSTKSEIWTVGDLFANTSIDFYYDIEDYDLTTYDYYVSVVPSSLDYSSFRGEVFRRSDTFTRELLPGTYIARLEREYEGQYRLLDSYLFTVSDSEDDIEEDIIVSSSIPDTNNDMPDLTDDGEYVPPELMPGDGNLTINQSLFSGYYEGVGGAFNGLNTVTGSFIYRTMAPIRLMSGTVVSVASVGTTSMNQAASLFAPAGVVLSALLSSIPAAYKNLITLVLFMSVVMLLMTRSG